MARKNVFVVGKTTEEKFGKVEQTLQRFSRRLSKTIIGVIPPTIIQGFAHEPDEDGTVFRAFIPIGGKLAGGGLYVDSYSTNQLVTFYCNVISPDARNGMKLVTKKQSQVLSFDFNIPAMSRLVIKVDDPKAVKDVWVGIALIIEPSEQETKQFLISELEKSFDSDSNA